MPRAFRKHNRRYSACCFKRCALVSLITLVTLTAPALYAAPMPQEAEVVNLTLVLPDGRTLKVHGYPDTFRDGMGIQVTVQGELAADGVFLANQVIPRCPSKYEMQQKMEAGEKMPYDPDASLPGQS